MKKTTKLVAGLSALVAVTLFTTASGCESDADKVSRNVSTAADNFEVQRLIVGVNAITDKPAFSVEGRCSIESSDRRLVVTCKQGPDDYRKHYLGLADNVYWVSTQLNGVDASVYRTRIILKPTNIIPDFDLSVGKR